MSGADQVVRLTAVVRGHVQGVGFRWWVSDRGRDLGLVGVATNLPDGRVEVLAEGSERTCRELLAALRSPGAPGRVSAVDERWGTAQGGLRGFQQR